MRYYFHVGDGQIARDLDGEDHVDVRSAAVAAVQILAEMVPSQLLTTRRFSVAVKDKTGRLVALLTTTATLDFDSAPDEPPSM